ncbi:hypothetical protein [Bacillus alkalicellulosilyticus]|uniref:hypothetical protein n=1 Tax=Alkalihalobacterium alkalicellulosilyticum TaxID=1912214 RepID=UPI000997F4C3|nr:hypothetical protein [Bacillus alkalicellulosilyticus]
MIEYFLALDETRSDDIIINVDGIDLLVNQKALDEIGDYLKIDFVPSQGLKLINRAQTLAYAQQVKKTYEIDPRRKSL